VDLASHSAVRVCARLPDAVSDAAVWRCDHYEAASWADALRHTAALWKEEFGDDYGGYGEYVADELAHHAAHACGGEQWVAQLEAYTRSVEGLRLNFDNAATHTFGAGYELRIDTVPPPPLRLLCGAGLWSTCREGAGRVNTSHPEAVSSMNDGPSCAAAPRSVPTPQRCHRISFSATEALQDIGWYTKFQAWLEDHAAHARADGRRQRSNMPLRWLRGYHRMLFFARTEHEQRGSCRLHPPMGVDLFWHAHMLRPAAYRRDCQRLVGRLLAHQPWPSEHADRAVAFADGSAFDARWAAVFGRAPDHDLRKADAWLPQPELRQMRIAQVGFPLWILQYGLL
jgi:hypothetical protein